MSKYWLRSQVSGRRKGKEKIWAHETSQRTKRRYAVPVWDEQRDLTSMAATGLVRVTMVPVPSVGSLSLPSSLLGESAELIGQQGSERKKKKKLSLAASGC